MARNENKSEQQHTKKNNEKQQNYVNVCTLTVAQLLVAKTHFRLQHALKSNEIKIHRQKSHLFDCEIHKHSNALSERKNTIKVAFKENEAIKIQRNAVGIYA